MTKSRFNLRNVVKIGVACLAVCMMFTACVKESSNKQITAFGFSVPPAVGVINEAAKTVSVEVPLGTDVSALVPSITVSEKATISPMSGVAQDFTNPVTYTVTAEDGSAVNYIVTVTAGGISGNPIELISPITADRTLKDLGLPIDYFYNGDYPLQVKNNAILTIEPGVTIQFRKKGGGIEIVDGATIKALGTAEKRIQFIGATTNKGSWDKLYIDNSNTSNQLAYCDFINGGSTVSASSGVLTFHNAKVSIQHCKISGGLGTGIYTQDWSGRPTCEFTAFNNNVIEGFETYPPVIIGDVYESLGLISKMDMTSDFTNNTKKYIEVSPYLNSSKDVSINQTTVPYYSKAGIYRLNDYTLTINKGVTIYMADGQYFCDRGGTGRLLINGTATEKVKITRMPGTAQNWGGIYFDGLNGSEINHCILEYGGKTGGGQKGMIILPGSWAEGLTLNNVEINNSYSYGVHIGSCGYHLTHNNVTFNNNKDGNVKDDCAGVDRPDLP